jgi:hypothetical protein
MKRIAYTFFILAGVLSACENSDWAFPDYDYQTVYFATQYPVRTITLGEDIIDTSLDNEWKCKIMATTGGVYESRSDVAIDITVDNSMCTGLAFGGSGRDIMPMPANYYTLSADRIIIPKGQLVGGVEVQLTDDFFNDPLAISNNYVIPVRMTGVVNADSILSGKPLSDEPRRVVASDWSTAPKDYIFYAIKYINPWHGYYLRRGIDHISGDVNATIVRHKKYVEEDEVKFMNTRSLSDTEYPLVFKDASDNNINCKLTLSFDEQGGCTISSGTEGVSASGSGKFVSKGEKKSWGDRDRDAIYLNYTIDLPGIQVSATDTLVLRNRGVVMEVFNPILD